MPRGKPIMKGGAVSLAASNPRAMLVMGVAIGALIAVALFVILGHSKTVPAQQPVTQQPVAQQPVAQPQKQVQQPVAVMQPVTTVIQPQIDSLVAERDRRVDEDNLYPPLARERVTQRDTYRPVAYLVLSEEDTGHRGDVWKLYARERSYGGRSDFYAVSADRQFDAKVALTDENTQSQPRLRDVYNLPTAVKVNHPLFRPNASYQVVEMDRADWGATPNYF